MANEKLPNHKWWLRPALYNSGKSRFFQYDCTVCGCTTLNGMPLRPPFDKKCSKRG